MSDEKEYKPINASLHDGFWLDYDSSHNLTKCIEECQKFYNGDQWPEHGNDGFPRPVLNVISYAMNLKASKIVGTPLYFAITSDSDEADCTKLRQFDEYMQSKLGLKTFNFQSNLNGLVNGTEIQYYRWDKDNETVMGIYKGGLAIEHIDPRCFAVANPSIESIQKQKWVMFWCDCEVGAVKEIIDSEPFSKATAEAKKKNIEREYTSSNDSLNQDREKINHGLVTVFTRFFRINGEVYFDCSTDKVDLYAYPHALSTTVNEAFAKKAKEAYDKAMEQGEVDENGNLIRDLDIDFEDVAIGDSPSELNSEESHKRAKEKFSLYPFVIFRPYQINGSFFGRSDVKDMIIPQQTLNFNTAIVMQSGQNSAYNKYLVKPDTLKGQKITNEPGQVLTDFSTFVNDWGIKAMGSQPLPNDLIQFNNLYLEQMSKYGGFNDVMGGNVTNKDISGYAVQQMIKQANTPIEQQQQIFWQSQVDGFYIRLLFYKFYVDKAQYTFDLTDGEMQEQENARRKLLVGASQGLPDMVTGKPFTDEQKQLLMRPTRKTQVRKLTGDDLWGLNFDIRVDAEQGLADSKLTEEQFWDNLILNGGITKLEPDMLDLYIQGSPSVPPQAKAEMRRLITNLKQSEASQLKGQIQQCEQVIQQITEYAKSLEAKIGVNSEYLNNLTSEFTNKINAANKYIKLQGQALAQAQAKLGMSEGEAKSNNALGIPGSDIAPETQQAQLPQ